MKEYTHILIIGFLPTKTGKINYIQCRAQQITISQLVQMKKLEWKKSESEILKNLHKLHCVYLILISLFNKKYNEYNEKGTAFPARW